MVGIENSRNPEKLKKIIAAARYVFNGYYGITKEDKEEMLMNIIYKFEVADKEFPVSCYTVLAKKEIWSYFVRKTAKKRMQQATINGKTVYLEEVSLNMRVGEEEEVELGDLLPKEDGNLALVEYIASIEKDYPDIYILIKRAMNGEELEEKELKSIRNLLKGRI